MSWFKRIFNRSKEPDPREISSWLLDKSVEFGDRDDAAMALGDFDSLEAENTLLALALDHTEDDMIADTAGDSLLQMWTRQGKKPEPALVARMHPAARRYFEENDA